MVMTGGWFMTLFLARLVKYPSNLFYVPWETSLWLDCGTIFAWKHRSNFSLLGRANQSEDSSVSFGVLVHSVSWKTVVCFEDLNEYLDGLFSKQKAVALLSDHSCITEWFSVYGICCALSQHHLVLPGLLVQARADAQAFSIHGSISLNLKHQ